MLILMLMLMMMMMMMVMVMTHDSDNSRCLETAILLEAAGFNFQAWATAKKCVSQNLGYKDFETSPARLGCFNGFLVLAQVPDIQLVKPRSLSSRNPSAALGPNVHRNLLVASYSSYCIIFKLDPDPDPPFVPINMLLESVLQFLSHSFRTFAIYWEGIWRV